MTLEEKCKEYQKILVDEYRESHKEETEGLTDEEWFRVIDGLTGTGEKGE